MSRPEETPEEMAAYKNYLVAWEEREGWSDWAQLLGLPGYRRAERKAKEAWRTYRRLVDARDRPAAHRQLP